MFAVLLAVLSTLRATAAPEDVEGFHLLLPTANVLWAFPAALAVIVPQEQGTAALAAVVGASAAAHFGIAAGVWRRAALCAAPVPAITVF